MRRRPGEVSTEISLRMARIHPYSGALKLIDRPQAEKFYLRSCLARALSTFEYQGLLPS
ncbi:MAG: hypothetical protein ACI915_002442 [Gammaproteobacteria bacterium]|jgi:hypothetical protein